MLVYRRLILVVLVGLALSCTFNPRMDPDYWPCKADGTCEEGCECFDGRVCIPEGDETDPVLCEWCEPGHKDCDGYASTGCEVDPAVDPKNCGDCEVVCPEGWLCEVGTCVQGCKTGFVECGDSCVDPKRDPDHCGGCGQACKSNQACLEGGCVGDCGELNDCDGSCTDIKNDPENCGRCGRLCVLPNARPKCELSVCLVDTCIHPFGDCDREMDGCETDLKISASDCGSCGNACGVNMGCLGGECNCNDYFADCDDKLETGCEIRVKTDPMNCGECGNVCDQPPGDYCEENFLMVHPRLGDCAEYTCSYEPVPSECPFGCESGQCLGDPCEEVLCDEGEICVNGACACGGTGSDCFGEQFCCGTDCVYLWEDPNHCGECFASCGQNAFCMSGYCNCDTGFGNCDGAWSNGCENDLTGLENCGSCLNDCASGEDCCGGVCTDIWTDPGHCGGCASACTNGTECCSGGCKNLMSDTGHCGDCDWACVGTLGCNQGTCGSPGVDCGRGTCNEGAGEVCCLSAQAEMGCNLANDCLDHMFDCDGPEDCEDGLVCCVVMTSTNVTQCVWGGDCPGEILCTSDVQCDPDAPFCCPDSVMGVTIYLCMNQCG